MAIQIPNPGTGNGASGDNEFVLWSKVKDNFSDQTNAASRLVGTASGNVMEVGAFGFGGSSFISAENVAQQLDSATLKKTIMVNYTDGFELDYGWGISFPAFARKVHQIIGGSFGTSLYHVCIDDVDVAINQRAVTYSTIWTSSNATKDSNGFLKGASPVIDMYDNKIDLNNDAEKQGGITFEKLGVGDYLVKGSLGFAQEGWYIETPKDANGNVLVAVVYEQLANNDLSIKTYAKRFDDETGDIVPNLLKPRDIPTGRFISLRLHELPKEPPVMPAETQTEV